MSTSIALLTRLHNVVQVQLLKLVLQMKEAAQYHFTTESIMLSRENRPAISGMTGREFQKRLNSMINTDPANTGGYPEAPLAYDAVWLVLITSYV